MRNERKEREKERELRELEETAKPNRNRHLRRHNSREVNLGETEINY